MLEKIEKKLKNFNLPEYVENTLLFFLALFIATAIHEASHALVATILGVKAGIMHIGLITGATGVEETTNLNMILIALAGPIGSYLAGLYFWFSEGENSKLRLLSIFLLLTSSVFQLIPYGVTDGMQAIKYGLNPFIELSLLVFLASVTANLFIKEIKT